MASDLKAMQCTILLKRLCQSHIGDNPEGQTDLENLVMWAFRAGVESQLEVEAENKRKINEIMDRSFSKGW